MTREVLLRFSPNWATSTTASSPTPAPSRRAFLPHAAPNLAQSASKSAQKARKRAGGL